MRHGSSRTPGRCHPAAGEQGFTLLETMVALLVLLVVMASVMSSMLRFSQTQGMVWNRSNMHGAVRSATELLQQEVGQAGRVSLPSSVWMLTAVTSPGWRTVAVTSTAGMFAGEQLVIDTGADEETVTALAVGSASITANFSRTHSLMNPVPVTVRGGFATGIVPTNMTNGSTASLLKLYGDINGDGNLVYVEYVCDTANGTLSRNMMPFNAATKQAVNASQVLLTNVLPNPGGAPCFTYEQKTVYSLTYVLNLAITLTSRTQVRDRSTGQFQTETKALLNVAPRNVFETWQLASIGATNRIQPMPPSVLNLLPTAH
jgi:prepilin-type N-terminal cleavage/methylation domain-containing protein